MLKHSLLQHDGTWSKDITRLEFEKQHNTTRLQAVTLHEDVLKVNHSNISKITP
jgi:hypothetical protein